jgi:predicted DNA-binding transcriptional regulator AlpA
MTWWSVAIETEASAGEDLPADALDKLLDLLADHAGAVGGDERGYSVQVSVEAADADKARAAAARVVAGACKKAGVPAWPVVRSEVVRDDVLEAELAESPFPELAGTQEVAKLLGVSRQRVAEIRNNETLGFPKPIITLAAGPIWVRSAVEQWLEGWERKPGRPRKVAARPLVDLMAALEASLKAAKGDAGPRTSQAPRQAGSESA